MTTRQEEVERILKQSRQGQIFSVEHILVGHKSEIEESHNPPFGGTLVSPPDSPIRVFVGGVSEAMYPTALIERNIVGVINVAYSQCIESQRMMKMSLESNSQWDKVEFSHEWYRAQLVNPSFQYLKIPAEDHPKYKIGKHFEECIDFLNSIEETAKRNSSYIVPGVLVHCMQGYNRSVAICVAWLLRRFKSNLVDTVSRISAQRPLILSNRAFIRELVLFEELNKREENQHIMDEKKRQIFSIGEIVERV